MNRTNNRKLTVNSQKLRKSMTKEERHLWYDFLKGLPCTVHRQKVIGSYIVDFYIASAKTVIELDGSQHYESEGQATDLQRDNYLNSLGIYVLRYSNADVNYRFDSVCRDIWYRCIDVAPLGEEIALAVDEAKPSPRGEGGPR